MYKSEEVLRKTQPYQVPLYNDKDFREILNANGLMRQLDYFNTIYLFDDCSMIVDFDGYYKAYPEPSDQKPRTQPRKWVSHYICNECGCNIKEQKLLDPEENNIAVCGDCMFSREGDEYYGLRPQPKTLVEILKESSTDVPTLNLKESQ